MALVMQNTLRKISRIPTLLRYFHDEFASPEPLDKKHTSKKAERTVSAAGSIANKYKIFSDVDAPLILDIDEERQLQLQQEQNTTVGADTVEQSRALADVFRGINLQRGQTGVYDIDDLVTVLRLNNAENVFVCTVPSDIKYVDYICVVTGMSFRHMRGIAEFVRKIFKTKRNSSDLIPKIEGENSRDWMALDLGNIALHIFSESAREQYDLESLWAVGAKYDHECNKPEEPLVELFERHSMYLNDLKPLKQG